MSVEIPTVAEARIEETVAAFREGLTAAALRIARINKRPTLQPYHVNKATIQIFWQRLVPPDFAAFILDCDEDDEIPAAKRQEDTDADVTVIDIWH